MPRATVPANNESGFTLLELIGVLAVITILSTLVLPSVIHRLDAGNQDAEDENLEAIAKAIELSIRENRAWPANLASLSPNYLAMNTLHITQNKGGFPRYYVVHPDVSGFSNAAGLAPSDLGEARFLLISNLKADAAPTITNAAEFDTWWNTDETSTPNLKIHRGNVGDMFRLLNLRADAAGGSYQIDGVATNPGCVTLAEHTRYHLPGTVVGLDEAGTFSVPEVQFAQAKDVGYRFDCGHPVGAQWRKEPVPGATCWGLWLTTAQDISGGGSAAPCLATWDDAEIIQVGYSNLAFEPGTTDGTFSSVANMENQSWFGLASLHAIHYVTRDITVGTTNTFDLKAGDLLLAHHGATSELIVLVWAAREDVFVFRPNTPGDYSSGMTYMLLDNLSGDHVHAISLIETDTVVGDTTLRAGTFLFSRSGGGTKEDIWHFSPTSVGWGTTSGTLSTLLDGPSIGINQEVQGLDLIETQITVGDVTLGSGTILVTLKADDSSVGTNSIATKEQDIFYLDVTSTEIVGGTSVATATLLLEGADVGLTMNQEDLAGLSLAPTN